jgi:hypothetical protein
LDEEAEVVEIQHAESSIVVDIKEIEGQLPL